MRGELSGWPDRRWPLHALSSLGAWITEMRRLYCRLCAHVHDSIAGDQPHQCPKCEKPAHWTTEPVPTVAWAINENDRKFLRSIRVCDNNDHEDDAA